MIKLTEIDPDGVKCKQCGYEDNKYEGYCFQCACDKGIEQNPYEEPL